MQPNILVPEPTRTVAPSLPNGGPLLDDSSPQRGSVAVSLDMNVPTPLAIDTFDADCDLTLRPRRLAAQMLDRADDAIGCEDMPRVKKLIWEAQARWGGHTDVYIGISTLRVYERSLQALMDSPPSPLAITCAVVGSGKQPLTPIRPPRTSTIPYTLFLVSG